MRAHVLEGQMSLFDLPEKPSRSCHDCAGYCSFMDAERQAEQRRKGLANCWLLRTVEDGRANRDFSDRYAERCSRYSDSANLAVRELYNPADRARRIIEVAGLDESKWYLPVMECCEVSMVRCPERWKRGWYERTKGIADAAQLMDRNAINAPSLFSACYALGVFDYSLDYHVIWDRCWAARNGVPWSEACKVMGWDYGKREPIW